jgi:flagellar hook-associated protein 2
MATISSLGIGSGIDVNSVISQLLAVERIPLTKLQTQATAMQTQLSTYGKLQSAMSTLRDAASALTKSDTWGQTVGTSSDASAVSVTTSTATLAGQYAVNVTALASVQSNVSAVYPSANSIVGEGTLRITLGGWSGTGGTTFTPKAGATAVDISAGPPAQSLAELRDKINAAGAGVTASVVTDSSGARLVIRSNATGESNGFRIGVTDNDGNNTDGLGLSALAYDPAAGVLTMGRALAASNAAATLNGMAISAESNTLTNVVDGLSLTLNKVTTAPVQLTAAQDNESLKKAMNTFVTAYNDLNKLIVDQTKYDTNNKKGDNLQGDSAAISMRAQMRSLVGATTSASSAFTRLADVGVDVQTDGSIKLNDSKFTQSLGNLAEIKKLFATSDTVTPANNGIATRMRNLADQMLGTDGSVKSRQEGLRSRIERNKDSQDAMTERIANVEKRLKLQYTALDRQMGQINGLSGYVTAQLNALSNNSNR